MEAATATVPGVQHYQRLTSLNSSQFSERLDKRGEGGARIAEVIATAATNGDIEQWEYPEVERALGITFAALFNVQLVPTQSMGGAGDLSQLLSSARGARQ